MARIVFKMPDVGEGTAEAEIVAWHVAIGDSVAEDQLLVEIMTEKATVELTSPIAGTVIELCGNPGDMAVVGAPLVVFERVLTDPATEERSHPAPVPQSVAVDEGTNAGVALLDRSNAAAEAAPAVRRRARDLGIALHTLRGTGPSGRITHADLDALLQSRGETGARLRPAASSDDAVTEVKVIGLRRKIAERMSAASRDIPHFSYVEEVDVTAVEDLRRHLNQRHVGTRPRLTLLPFLIRALVAAVTAHPQINALFEDGVIRRHAALHLGIATQTPSGLMVPVLRQAQSRDLWGLATEIARLAAAARDGSATKDELQGSTLTVSSLGALGGLASTPVINPPEVAIVGVNRVVERPVVVDGRVQIRRMMNLSSSFDHRVIDGWEAAQFIQAVKATLEYPATLFLD
jgi:2-oxoisovalerate dehydrogenase E2 component (dihydrolipoyl transacylase)